MYQKKVPCTIALAIMNIVIFLLLSFWGRTEDAIFMMEHGAMYVPLVQQDGEYYRLFTSMFLHFSMAHLTNNMLSLVLLGSQLEIEMGRIKYLILYIGSGLSGNILSSMIEISSGDYAVSAGASGAVFGIIGALLYITIRNRGRIGTISGKGLVFMILFSLYYGFSSTGIDNFAHIGGLAAGFLLAVLLYRKHYSEDCATAAV